MSTNDLTGSEESKFKIPRASLTLTEQLPERAIIIRRTSLRDDDFEILIEWNGRCSVTFANSERMPPQSIQLDTEQLTKVKALARALWHEGAETQYGAQEACPNILLLDGPHALSVFNIGKSFDKPPASLLYQFLCEIAGIRS